MDTEPIPWTKDKSKQFRNALCGLPKDHKSWQEWYKEGNLDEVYNFWQTLAEEEELNNSQRMFWTAIIEVIKHKTKQAVEKDKRDCPKGCRHFM